MLRKLYPFCYESNLILDYFQLCLKDTAIRGGTKRKRCSFLFSFHLIQIKLPAGGAFGAESSLAAVAGYLPVIILSLVNLKRKC